VKVDGGIGWDLDKVGEQACELEALGYSGLMTAETAHDPFFPLAVAAQHTEKVELMTSIAVAFSRSPMILANIGHDLNAASKGRFVLGYYHQRAGKDGASNGKDDTGTANIDSHDKEK